MEVSNSKIYSLLYSFENVGERIFFSFATLFADSKGATTAEQGLMLSLQNILSFIGQNFFGRASDDRGRPIIILCGYLVCIFSGFMIFRFINPFMIILIFAIYNIGFSMVQPAFFGLLGDTAAYENLERSSLLGSVTSFATLVGGIIYLGSGLVSEYVPSPYEFLFVTASISFLVAGIVVLILHFRHRVPPREVPKNRDGLSFLDPLKNKEFRNFVIIDSIFSFAISTTWPLFPHITNELATTAQVTIIWFVTFVSFSIVAKLASRIEKRIGNASKGLFVSRFIFFTVPLTFAFATDWTQLLWVRIVSGGSLGLYTVLQKGYILETSSALGRPEDRGWFLGAQGFVYGIFTFVGSLGAGLIFAFIMNHYPGIGYSELFLATSALRFLAAFAYLFVPAIKYLEK